MNRFRRWPFRLGLVAADIPVPAEEPAKECWPDGRWWRDSLMHPIQLRSQTFVAR